MLFLFCGCDKLLGIRQQLTDTPSELGDIPCPNYHCSALSHPSTNKSPPDAQPAFGHMMPGASIGGTVSCDKHEQCDVEPLGKAELVAENVDVPTRLYSSLCVRLATSRHEVGTRSDLSVCTLASCLNADEVHRCIWDKLVEGPMPAPTYGTTTSGTSPSASFICALISLLDSRGQCTGMGEGCDEEVYCQWFPGDITDVHATQGNAPELMLGKEFHGELRS
ncbi:hypothetical protein BKA82DRAFT_2420748 [Pisolithus tinctorius]|nr:hypothetical protein BKA82DRAFT_2420748 [Pisolithus tinctorius]